MTAIWIGRCSLQWSNKTATFLLGGTIYPQFNTSDACVTACGYDINDCGAAVTLVNGVATTCVIFNNKNDLSQTFDSNQANLYIVISRCPPSSKVDLHYY